MRRFCHNQGQLMMQKDACTFQSRANARYSKKSSKVYSKISNGLRFATQIPYHFKEEHQKIFLQSFRY